MRRCILMIFAFLHISYAFSQETARGIAEKARKKCLEISNGEYTLERKFKFVSAEDTIVHQGKVVFDKQPDDTLFGMLFLIDNLTDSFGYYYEGTAMHILRHYKKTITVDTVRERMLSSVKGNMSSTYINYPFIKNPMPFLDDSTVEISYAPEWLEKKNKDTLIILIKYPDEENGKLNNKWARWYIDAKTYLPVLKEMRMVYDNEVQYEYFKINAHSFNKKQHSQWLHQNNWPGYETVYYQPTVRPKPLDKDTTAPHWDALSLTGDSINFSNLKGKVYLVDFWYRSCLPCIKAMPFLQAMSNKYGAQGLHVIGLNPYDYKNKDTEGFKEFMQQQNLTYTLAFITSDVAKQYHVSAYPTLYLIDGNGVILHTQVGYGEEIDAELEKLISEYLETH